MTLSNRSLLNKTFLADGAYSLAVGAVLILGAAPLAALFSPAATPAMMKVLGVGLIFWGIFHLSAARNGGPVTTAARISITGDVLWQVASLALLVAAYPSLSVAGIGFIVIGLITVADFLFFKVRGLARERTAIALRG
ncbi:MULTISPECIES: hypothetical protein [unclassified Ensifer]|uniref:hypothetical protein n=1 Tax=unclassified Ensifer TaxID=2633371 RepID=UPI0008132170|nr:MULTISPECIES: hypothetical protein [unclassified Ensifer]OCP07487.1 hypothetical protein BBX50_21375 [Ensifer sp. LC11]OCP07593.1 hypothetical protein BC362_10635 [Ensifer sp. LC14]OCP08261.1 hypothetical protein BC374_21590 [Ensifer sp. LC13]OCP31982.1 hypothetical protein BC364_20845 [Ensifer sp. LC499]